MLQYSENQRMKMNAPITLVLLVSAALIGLEFFTRKHSAVPKTMRELLTSSLPG